MEIVNLAAYKFVSIPDPNSWRPSVKARCQELGVMGSILFSPEGINLFVAGERAATDAFLYFLRTDEMFGGRFTDLIVKESVSNTQPHKRIVVRLKSEIITMKHPMVVQPTDQRAPYVEPSQFKRWLDQGHDDEGRELLLLDTRNEFEVNIGTFDDAIHLKIEKFSEFPQAFDDTKSSINDALKNKTVVSFCTGGIRCEKAALFLKERNVPNVFQLDGGILRYFEEVGGAHWNGECFVFDRRIALDPALNPTQKEYEITAKPSRMDQYYRWKAKKESEAGANSSPSAIS
ncbi:MAG: sulfurtransferase [Candidatus Obscuribacterales bacterium]